MQTLNSSLCLCVQSVAYSVISSGLVPVPILPPVLINPFNLQHIPCSPSDEIIVNFLKPRHLSNPLSVYSLEHTGVQAVCPSLSQHPPTVSPPVVPFLSGSQCRTIGCLFGPLSLSWLWVLHSRCSGSGSSSSESASLPCVSLSPSVCFFLSDVWMMCLVLPQMCLCGRSSFHLLIVLSVGSTWTWSDQILDYSL